MLNWKEMSDSQRHIVWLEDRVSALYNEAQKLNLDDDRLKEYSKDVSNIARDLEMYVDQLKRPVQ